MKRQVDRDSPNRGGSKRNRGRSPNRRHYRDNSPDFRDRESRITSRDARRTIQNRRRSPAYSPEINRSRRRNGRAQSEEYTTLVVSNFSNQLGKEDIENSLYYEFRKFGDVSLRITRDLDGNRIVFATFRSSHDAKECKNAKGHLVMHDIRLIIEIARENNHDIDRYSPVDNNRSSAHNRSPIARSPVRRRSPKRNVRNPPRDRGLARSRANYRERSPMRERVPVRERDRSFSYDRSPPPRNHYSTPERNSPGSRTPVKYHSISPRSPNSIRNRSISPRKDESKNRESAAKNEENAPANNDFSPRIPAVGPSPNQSFGTQDQSGYYPQMLDKPIPPEDDPYATRTLFVGNLEVEIGSRDIRKLFSRFGKIEDIDVKRAPRGVGGYCFVRFSNLNEAYKAKISVNGKAIKKNIVRVGYGKVITSSKIWVGGLGRWSKLSDLENEFDRFGAIRRIDFEKGDCSASILYETIDAAMAACNQMRGFLMPGADTRLRMDFLEPEPGMPGYEAFLEWGRHEGKPSDKNQDQRYRGRNVFVGDRKSLSPYSHSKSRRRSKHDATIIKETAATEMQIKQRQAKHCVTLHDLCQCFDPPCWQGGFVLKKVAFPVLFFLLNGDMGILNTTTADPNSSTGRQSMLLMRKRLRLEEDKLAEIKKRMKTCSKQTCLLVAVPGVPENLNMNVTLNGIKPIQHKPLRGLVKYLKEKSAAGIVSIPFITKDSHKNDNDDPDIKTSGFLHCFPPSSFASEQLLKIGPNLQPQMFADDYLVVLLVKGEKSAIL